jgi:hypothetical protein
MVSMPPALRLTRIKRVLHVLKFIFKFRQLKAGSLANPAFKVGTRWANAPGPLDWDAATQRVPVICWFQSMAATVPGDAMRPERAALYANNLSYAFSNVWCMALPS